jgi:PAS domain S-box-containing protein
MIQKLLKARRFPIRPYVFLILLIFAFISCPASTHAQAQPQNPLAGKNVLILHSLEFSAPVFVQTDQGLITTLESGGIPRVNQFFETLDLRRNPGPENRRLLVEQMRVRYSRRNLDMIVTMYPEALEFMLKDCRDIFPAVPILALYLPQSFESSETDRRIIRHFPTLDIIGTLEIALKLVPGAKRVYVVGGVHEVDRRVEDQARRELKKWEGRLEFHYLSYMPFEEMVATISTVPPDSIILALVLSRDVTGINFTSVAVAQRLSQVSRAPIFGVLDAALGHGSAGGSLINFERIGARAGEMLLDTLKGTRTTVNLPGFLDVPPVPMFDWRQLKHWNLEAGALPKGSIVINRELTFWDYKYYILGGLALCLAQSLLIAGLLIQRRQKKMGEEKLRKAEEKYRNIFEGSLEGIFETSPQGHPLTANPALAKILGFATPEEFISSIRDVANQVWVDPNERAEYIRLLERENNLFAYKCQFWRKDRMKIWVSLSARRVCGPDGQTLFYSGFLEDITERTQAEEEAARARAELLHVDRMMCLNELSASLAHELNQPLAAILSSAQAALRFLQSATPDLNLLRTILQNIAQDDKRAAGTITSLRSLMKREEREREPLNVNTVLDDVLNLFYTESIVRKVTTETDFDSSLPPVLGDKIQLQQVVLNLLMNAADATSGSPHEQEKRKIILRTQATDQGIQVAVRDFGPGIDPAKLVDIWQPFFTTKTTGLGMGLSISRSIVQAHGGRIWAENHPDGGAMFTFEIPLVRNQ